MISSLILEEKTIEALHKAEDYQQEYIKGDFIPYEIEVRVRGKLFRKDKSESINHMTFGSVKL